MLAICVYFGADHQAALDATGCDKVFVPWWLGRQRGINYVVQLRGCLIRHDEALPNLAATIRELEALAEPPSVESGLLPVKTVAIGHEIGLTHLGAVPYLTALRREADALGISLDEVPG